MLNEQQFYLLGQVQISQTGGQPFSDTSPCGGCSLEKPSVFQMGHPRPLFHLGICGLLNINNFFTILKSENGASSMQRWDSNSQPLRLQLYKCPLIVIYDCTIILTAKLPILWLQFTKQQCSQGSPLDQCDNWIDPTCVVLRPMVAKLFSDF